MLVPRIANQRGHANHGWLKAFHTFSFGSYHDPSHMGFRALRVMNEDRIEAGQGFGTHPHRDMEIVTYVLSGALEHRDSMGNGEVLRAGELQRMTAGTGITHSEFNPSATEPVHLVQIWLHPREQGLPPSYEQKRFDATERQNRLRLVASPDGLDGSLKIHQDAQIYLSNLQAHHQLAHHIAPSRHAWLQVLRGSVNVNGLDLETSDGLQVSEETELTIRASKAAEILLFDLA